MTWHYRLGRLAAQTEVRWQDCLFKGPLLGGGAGEILWKGSEKAWHKRRGKWRMNLMNVIIVSLCFAVSHHNAHGMCSFNSFTDLRVVSLFTHTTISHLPCVLIPEQSCVLLLRIWRGQTDLSSSSLAWDCAQTLIRVPHSCLSQSPALCQQYKSCLTLTFVILQSRDFWDVGLCVEGN